MRRKGEGATKGAAFCGVLDENGSAVLQGGMDVFHVQLVSLLDVVVVVRIIKCERQDAEVDEVFAVDARVRLCKDGTDAKVAGCNGGMLARGALAIVTATDNNASAVPHGQSTVMK